MLRFHRTGAHETLKKLSSGREAQPVPIQRVLRHTGFCSVTKEVGTED